MFQMNLEEHDESCVMYLEGCLRTPDAEEFEKRLLDIVKKNRVIKIDMEKTEFVCSAILRAMLAAQTIVDNEDKEMILSGVNDDIYGVLKMTGFHNILTIE